MPARDIIPANYVYELSDGDTLDYGDETQNSVYAFGLALAEGTYHVQRWFILARDPKRRPPTRSLTLKPTAHPGWRDATTKAPFVNLARQKFSANAFYAKVNCARLYGVATLPRPLPTVQWLGNPTGEFQPDIGTTHLNVGPGRQDTVGFIHTTRHGQGKSLEQWVLQEDYAPAVGRTKLELLSSNAFSDLMNGAAWDIRATLVTCACSYFTSVPPDADA